MVASHLAQLLEALRTCYDDDLDCPPWSLRDALTDTAMYPPNDEAVFYGCQAWLSMSCILQTLFATELCELLALQQRPAPAVKLRQLLDALGERYIDDASWDNETLAAALQEVAWSVPTDETFEGRFAWLTMSGQDQAMFADSLCTLLTLHQVYSPAPATEEPEQ